MHIIIDFVHNGIGSLLLLLDGVAILLQLRNHVFLKFVFVLLHALFGFGDLVYKSLESWSQSKYVSHNSCLLQRRKR